MALVFLAIPLVLGAALAVFTLVIILVARQALVIILIIISPLAFVALLLPNTQKLFDKWRSTLISLLLMYPIVSIIFGGAQIAGFAILSTVATAADPVATGVAILTGQFVIVAPFFFLPLILTKFSGGGLDSIAARIKSSGQKLIGGVSGFSRKAGMDRLGRGWNQLKYRPQSDRSHPSVRGRMRNLLRTGGMKYDQMKDSEKFQDATLAEERQSQTRQRLGTDQAYATRAGAGDYATGQSIAARAVAAAEAEELKKALQPLARAVAGMNNDDRKKHLEGEVAKGGVDALAALHYAGQISEVGLLRQSTKSADPNIRRMANEAIQANVSNVMPKAADLVKGVAGAFKSPKAEDVAGWDADTMKSYMEYMGGLAAGSNDRKIAVASFNAALDNIATNPTLRGKHTVVVGKTIQQEAANNGLSAELIAIPARIKPTGEII